MTDVKLILASASPRRQELLKQLIVRFDIASADLDETQWPKEAAGDYVKRLALEKARTIYRQQGNQSGSVVLGSDTCVAIEDVILGKPEDASAHRIMMKRLSGKWHQVYTAVAMISQQQEKIVLVKTEVKFAPLSDDEISAYWLTGEPCDKAGGYGIQGLAGKFIEKIHGSYSAVVGLPLYETNQLLKHFGLVKADNYER